MTQKTPLLLLPGLLCDAALWQAQIAALGEESPIQVGDLTQDDSVAGIAKRVLAKAPRNFALAGLSMGGYVALEIMRQAPERVKKLALMDTSPRPDTPEQRERRMALIDLAQRGKFKGVTPRLLPLLIHEDRLNDAHVTGVILAMAERIGRDAFIRQQNAILGRADSWPHLKEIRVPTMIICGKQDALTPPDISAEMAEKIPDSDFHLIEDCGHLAPLEKPNEVTELMRAWLSEDR